MGVGSSATPPLSASLTRTVSVLVAFWLEGVAAWLVGDACMLGTPLGPATGCCAAAIGLIEPGGMPCAFAMGGMPGTAFTPGAPGLDPIPGTELMPGIPPGPGMAPIGPAI